MYKTLFYAAKVQNKIQNNVITCNNIAIKSCYGPEVMLLHDPRNIVT